MLLKIQENNNTGTEFRKRFRIRNNRDPLAEWWSKLQFLSHKNDKA